ncbi:DUF2157 domain-containing protein [Desulfitobacterium metallireducens]|uniref:DUF2157 domain-containing protein n=1 Tax=Desulfitobacterium metallireducens DSM 15288 TaxID=871968 RepID=W0EG47_9FIRM|nr:DUF2157 domain-containing protein [Desulfitobacterium metallireducens]AHF08498.1 hypothetical protein DESME_05405 [Desulfitobacterium metallireducens DSM 15288]
MKDRNIKWLHEEIPKWVAKDVVSEETGIKIQNYYGEVEEPNGLKMALAIFGTLGAVLIGSGIILLFAKNWDNFSLTLRTVLSLLPLILAQILTGWVIFTGKNSPAWREGTAVFLFLMIGASISLIGQTYHIPGDTPQFILTWILLSLPIIYLLEVTVPAILYILGTVIWAGVTRGEGGYTFLYWLLLALVSGFLYKMFKYWRSSNHFLFLELALILSLCISLSIVLEQVLPGIWIIVYSCYFTILFLMGWIDWKQSESDWQKPLLLIGLMGSLIFSIVLSYKGIWEQVGWKYYGQDYYHNTLNATQDYILMALMGVGVGYLLNKFFKQKDTLGLIFSALPVLAILGFLLASFQGAGISDLLFDAYLLILGIFIVIRGLKIHSLGLTNGGMLILAVLIILRFFDSGLGFLEKGIAFILVGLGFLLANYVLVRRQKGGEQ